MSITTKPEDYRVLFLDMNSFFASVEQQVQPTLRGLPVGVAPYTGNTGCIIAASKEAKAMGVKICQVGEARKLCPQIRIVEARPALYMIYHKEIRKVIESFTPYFDALSIDEFAIRLTKLDQSRAAATRLALNLKQAIRERVGDYLSCSIGIGPSVFLAKMAGERHKPDGLTVVTLQELEQFYAPLVLTDLVGINWRLEKRLKISGIESPLALYNSKIGELMRILNHGGRLWYFRLRGYEVDDVIVKNKTVGHSHVLSPELRTKEAAISVLKKLIMKAGVRLRHQGYEAAGVSVSIQFMGVEGFHLSRRFAFFSDSQTFVANAMELVRNCPWSARPILIAVAAFDLKPKAGEQISIFKDVEKSKAISKALDEVNDEFGADTVFPASMFTARDSAPDRIPFGRPRYDIVHGT